MHASVALALSLCAVPFTAGAGTLPLPDVVVQNVPSPSSVPVAGDGMALSSITSDFTHSSKSLLGRRSHARARLRNALHHPHARSVLDALIAAAPLPDHSPTLVTRETSPADTILAHGGPVNGLAEGLHVHNPGAGTLPSFGALLAAAPLPAHPTSLVPRANSHVDTVLAHGGPVKNAVDALNVHDPAASAILHTLTTRAKHPSVDNDEFTGGPTSNMPLPFTDVIDSFEGPDGSSQPTTQQGAGSRPQDAPPSSDSPPASQDSDAPPSSSSDDQTPHSDPAPPKSEGSDDEDGDYSPHSGSSGSPQGEGSGEGPHDNGSDDADAPPAHPDKHHDPEHKPASHAPTPTSISVANSCPTLPVHEVPAPRPIGPPPTKEVDWCPVAHRKCCDKSLTHSDILGEHLVHGFLGLPRSELSLTGLQCIPLVKDILGRYSCSAQPLCCSGAEYYRGLLHLGCVPIQLKAVAAFEAVAHSGKSSL